MPFKIQRKKTMPCENYSMLEVEPLRLMENITIVINIYSIDLRPPISSRDAEAQPYGART